MENESASPLQFQVSLSLEPGLSMKSPSGPSGSKRLMTSLELGHLRDLHCFDVGPRVEGYWPPQDAADLPVERPQSDEASPAQGGKGQDKGPRLPLRFPKVRDPQMTSDIPCRSTILESGPPQCKAVVTSENSKFPEYSLGQARSFLTLSLWRD